jgi:hypothetical protein
MRSFAAAQAPMIGLDTNILVRYLVQDDPGSIPDSDNISSSGASARTIRGL